jgi:hypothetical protein
VNRGLHDRIEVVKAVVDVACAAKKRGQHRELNKLRRKLRGPLMDYVLDDNKYALKKAKKLVRKG